MYSISDHLLKKFKIVADTVKQDLKRQGLVVPTKNSDGSVSIENFTICKDKSGFYVIKNRVGDIVVDKINLPQTAALLANNLALGKWTNDEIYKLDQEYGYRLFETMLLKKNASLSIKKSNFDRADLLFIKLNISQKKVELAKNQIVSTFEKLRNITK